MKGRSSRVLTVGIMVLVLLGTVLSVAGRPVGTQAVETRDSSAVVSNQLGVLARGASPRSLAPDAADGFGFVRGGPSLNRGEVPETAFASSLQAVTFTESGLPTGTQWWVNLTPGGSIPIGNWPRAAAYDNANGYVYVANAADDSVTVLNGATDDIVGFIPVGSYPFAIAYDSANGYLYVANSYHLSANNVTVINTATDTVLGSVSVGSGPDGVAYDSSNGYVYVACSYSDNVTIINGATDTIVRSIPVGSGPAGVEYDGANGYIYVANAGLSAASHNVTVINGATDKVVGSVTVGSDPLAVGYDSVNGYVYVANVDSDNLTVINGATDTVVRSIPVGSVPAAAGYDSANGYVYVANFDSSNVTVINGATDAVVGSVPVGSSPAAVAYDNRNGYVYVANFGSNNMTVLNGATDKVLGSFTSSETTNNFGELNGTYTYTVGSANKSWAAPSGTFTVNGAPVSVDIQFSLQTYTVTVTETGLSAKQLAKQGWTVTLGGVTVPSHSASVGLPGYTNGSYLVLVQGPKGEVNSEAASYYQAVLGTTTVGVQFSKGKTATLTFSEKGLAKGAQWCVSVQSDRECSTSKSVKYSGISTDHPSNYYAVVSPTVGQTITVSEGKQSLPIRGTVSVSKNIKLVVTFAYPYAVTFSESGLSSGSWSITIKGRTETALWDQTIELNLTNGTYPYKVGSETGYKSVGAPAKIAVNGAVVTATVTFTKDG